jgi:hypothetical protein
MRDALEVLIRVPAGRALVERGLKFWKLEKPIDLLSVLRWGKASRTDAVLTRHLDPDSGKEVREREVIIYLRQGQRLEDLVLDIAHELVHATARPSWDPYDPKLTAGRYIHATIEGEGGEIEAVVAECRVGLELSHRFGASARRCRSYRAIGKPSEIRIEREKVREDFYRVGKWSAELGRRLGEEIELFPLLSPKAPRLYSSTGHAPYPVALLQEFDQLTQIACENTRKRAQAVKEQGRKPASSALEFLSSRCGERADEGMDLHRLARALWSKFD